MLRNSWFLKSAEIDFSWIFLITGYDVQCLEEGNNQEEDSNLCLRIYSAYLSVIV